MTVENVIKRSLTDDLHRAAGVAAIRFRIVRDIGHIRLFVRLYGLCRVEVFLGNPASFSFRCGLPYCIFRKDKAGGLVRRDKRGIYCQVEPGDIRTVCAVEFGIPFVFAGFPDDNLTDGLFPGSVDFALPPRIAGNALGRNHQVGFQENL